MRALLLTLLLAVPSFAEAPRLVRLTPELSEQILELFPNLRGTPWGVLAWQSNGQYNCFAWSVGVNDAAIDSDEVRRNGNPSLKHWDRFYRKHGYGQPSPEKAGERVP